MLSYFLSKRSLLFANNKSISLIIQTVKIGVVFDQCRRSIAPIILGFDGPTKRISAFVDRLIQPTAQKQDSYVKDTTDFLNFIDSTKLPKNTVLVSMDVFTSLHQHTTRRGRKNRMSRTGRFLWGQSPYTH